MGSVGGESVLSRIASDTRNLSLKPSTCLCKDQKGQVAVEYTLLLAGIGLPMVYIFKVLLDALTAYYQMVTFVQTLPLP